MQLRDSDACQACRQIHDTQLYQIFSKAFQNQRDALLTEMTNPATSVVRLQQLQMLGAACDVIESFIDALSEVHLLSASDRAEFFASLNLQLTDLEDGSYDESD